MTRRNGQGVELRRAYSLVALLLPFVSISLQAQGALNVCAPAIAESQLPSYTPPGPPIATRQEKFLGSAWSARQSTSFTAYWNQVTPENGGKWGSVESTRDVMNWSDLDKAYDVAKSNGFPFKLHTLVWGNQQPAWIESLTPDEQLAQITQWFDAVAARYPHIDFIDVVNEPLHDPPNKPGSGGGNYISALGGPGRTGWDWVLNSFRMARARFPNAKLLINEYDVTNDRAAMQRYVKIVRLLQAENLIDGVGVQAHAFTTRAGTPMSVHAANLDLLASTGLPIYVSELDIDGPTDAIQLEDYKRVFPVFWKHPAVKGITLWGFRPGLWRTAQGACLVRDNGVERPAMKWLRDYVQITPRARKGRG
jgi:endo-1,4-beta-xylanase